MKVVFFHPDLGIGGAERLIIDAALALQLRGYSVNIMTNHHSGKHCFDETRNGTLPVEVHFDWVPRSLFGFFHAIFAYIRMILLAFYFLFKSSKENVIICDQIAACVPVLKMSGLPVLFYCHFPDLLLTTRESFLKRIYRIPLDYLEEYGTRSADKILVNSEYTAQVVKDTFTSIKSKPIHVLHPTLNTLNFDNAQSESVALPSGIEYLFISINRYERKKQISLAIEAFAGLHKQLTDDLWDKCHLVIAGGYDNRVQENVSYLKELKTLSITLDVQKKVTFLKSTSFQSNIWLMQKATALLYTPSFEHFGIVPLEAMYMQLPVIAVKNGGPKETVVDGYTGFLCNPSAEDFSTSMLLFIRNSMLRTKFGVNGREWVNEKFSFDKFTSKLVSYVDSL